MSSFSPAVLFWDRPIKAFLDSNAIRGACYFTMKSSGSGPVMLFCLSSRVCVADADENLGSTFV